MLVSTRIERVLIIWYTNHAKITLKSIEGRNRYGKETVPSGVKKIVRFDD